jgi:hypothetical protein
MLGIETRSVIAAWSGLTLRTGDHRVAPHSLQAG